MTARLAISIPTEPLATICRKHHVRALWLASGHELGGREFRQKESDLDFLVEFDLVPEGGRADAYFGLRSDLQNLFDRSVDLVMVGALDNPYFAASVHATKVPVYAAA